MKEEVSKNTIQPPLLVVFLTFKIKHHFIRDYVQKGVLDIQFIDTDHQWADIFTKPLTVERFNFIKKNMNMHFVSE